jgi:hypothetical protein
MKKTVQAMASEEYESLKQKIMRIAPKNEEADFVLNVFAEINRLFILDARRADRDMYLATGKTSSVGLQMAICLNHAIEEAAEFPLDEARSQ